MRPSRPLVVVTTLTAVATAAVALAAPAAAGPHRWPQFGADAQHSGVGTSDVLVTPGTVGSLHVVFTATMPDGEVVDSPAAYQAAVPTAFGSRDLLFVTTKQGTTLAIDAHSGVTIWAARNPAGSCRINNGTTPCYTTAGPALDPSAAWVYAYGLDGRLHKYATATGAEVTTGGWPETTTVKPWDEKGSSDVAVYTARNGTTYVAMTNGGYPGDRGDYQGHVTVVNAATGAQQVFNTVCSDRTVHLGTGGCPSVQSAVWARGGVVYDADTDRIYLATGNGDYDPAHHDWADSVIALSPAGTGSGGDPLDTWTPTNYQALQDADLDLGSTAPAILHVPSGSRVAHVGLQGGKDGVLRLLDLDDLSGGGGPGHTGGELAALSVLGQAEILTAPVSWVDPSTGTDWAFVATGSGIQGFRVGVDGTGRPTLTAAWSSSVGGTTPVVSSGTLVYQTSAGARALDPRTGAVTWLDPVGNADTHWGSPTVAEGYLYYPDTHGHLRAYAVDGAGDDATVRGWYVDLLGRSPVDAAGDTSRYYWVGLLLGGTGRADAARRVLASPESVTRITGADYVRYLHRQPDAGASYWIDGQLSGRFSWDTATQRILDSSEYHARPGPRGDTGVRGWLQNLYCDLLDRCSATSVSDAELAYWTQVAARSGTPAVVQGVWTSDQAVQLRIQSDYQLLLGHGLFGGWGYWVDTERTDALAVRAGIAASDEYALRQLR